MVRSDRPEAVTLRYPQSPDSSDHAPYPPDEANRA